MNKVEAIRKLNETELKLGIAGTSASWHQKYESCPFIFIGGLPTAITEGDLLAMFEQYGIVVHINLVRDAETGKSRGFAFLKYHDPRSAILAVDNFTGTEVGGQTLRVDHAEEYTMPEEGRPGTIDTTPPELKIDNSTRMTVVTAEKGDDTIDVKADGDNDLAAEARREKAVLKRLRTMRKERAREEHKQNRNRGGDDSQLSRHTNGSDLEDSVEPEAGPRSSNGHASRGEKHHRVSRSRIEKRRRKEEKEQRKQRKAERARIREERKKRRADREEKR